MRSTNIYGNVSNLSRMVIKEENDDDDEIEINMIRDRNDQYSRSASAIHFSRSSIIRTHQGTFHTPIVTKSYFFHL